MMPYPMTNSFSSHGCSGNPLHASRGISKRPRLAQPMHRTIQRRHPPSRPASRGVTRPRPLTSPCHAPQHLKPPSAIRSTAVRRPQTPPFTPAPSPSQTRPCFVQRSSTPTPCANRSTPYPGYSSKTSLNRAPRHRLDGQRT